MNSWRQLRCLARESVSLLPSKRGDPKGTFRYELHMIVNEPLKTTTFHFFWTPPKGDEESEIKLFCHGKCAAFSDMIWYELHMISMNFWYDLIWTSHDSQWIFDMIWYELHMISMNLWIHRQISGSTIGIKSTTTVFDTMSAASIKSAGTMSIASTESHYHCV